MVWSDRALNLGLNQLRVEFSHDCDLAIGPCPSGNILFSGKRDRNKIIGKEDDSVNQSGSMKELACELRHH